jgi:cytochrome c oxidase subunit I+III
VRAQNEELFGGAEVTAADFPPTELPHPEKRPESELEELKRIWHPPSGIRVLTIVNNTHIGVIYVATSLLFFVLAGILAVMMRTQLAVPDNDLISHDL